jgi:hypothetical protein
LHLFSVTIQEAIVGLYPAGTTQKGSIGALDAGGEKASVAFWLPVITAANEVAQAAAWGTVLSTWDALFLGERYRDVYNDTTTYAVVRPTNGAAREISLKLIARDATTGQTVDYYCPTLDISLISYDPNYGAKDVVDLTTTELAAFIDALEAMPLKNPFNYANNMTIVGAQVVKGQK